jgi:hypothetical protein
MQTVSSAFTTATAASFRNISHGLLVAWQQAINSSYAFFTIGTSKIGGADSIKGAGGSTTFFDRYQYTNETPYVMDWKITRSVSQQPWGVILSSATVMLDNTTNRFTPGFDPTIGAYTALANRPMKIQCGFGGELINVFVGFTDNTATAAIGSRQYSVQLFDALTFLQGVQSTQPMFVNMTRDQIITSLLINDAGFSSSQINIEPSVSSTVAYYSPYGLYLIDIFNEMCEAEGAIMFVDETGIINWQNRSHIGTHNTVQWAFSYSNTIGNPQYVTTTIINDVNVTTKPLAVGNYNLIFQDTSGYLVPPGGTLLVIADLNSTNISAATSIDTPYWVSTTGTGLSTFTTNLNADGSGLTSSAVTLASHTLTGSSYYMNFSNSSTSPVYLTNISLWGVPVSVQSVQTSPFIDTNSIGLYNTNPNNNYQEIEIENDTLQNQYEAYALANWYVQLYNVPYARFKINPFAVPQLQLFDWVSFFVADTSTTINAVIMAHTLELQAPGNLTQMLDIEQRANYAYFTINVSTIGGTDRIAP